MLNIDDLKSKIEELSRDLERKQKEYNSLFEEMNTGFAFHKIISNKEGNPIDYVFLKVNSEYERQTGLKADDILGRTALEILPKTDKKWIDTYGKVAMGGEPVRFELYIADLDKYFDVNAYSPFKNFFVTTFYDITLKKKAANLIADSEWKYRTIFQNMSEGMVFNDLVRDEKGEVCNFLISDVNLSYERMFEQPREGIVGKKATEVFNLTEDDIRKLWLKHKGFNEPVSFDIYDEKTEKYFKVSYTYLGKEKLATIHTDITELKNAFIKIEKSSEQLQEQNIAYQKLNTELQEINKDLKTAKEKAEQSDRLKSAFLANISHEIRTPMNGIVGYIDILLNDVTDEEQRKSYLRIIRSSSNQLLEIVNDIIDISKIESGVIDIYPSDLKVSDALEAARSIIQKEAESKGLEFKIENKLDPARSVFTDFHKVLQILSNILRNAVKFTEEGSIELIVEEKGEDCLFRIKDTGIGIEPENQVVIFEYFRKADTSVNIARGGNGLGLAISRAYVNKLGGRIWVESTPGKGSEFMFTLPFKGI